MNSRTETSVVDDQRDACRIALKEWSVVCSAIRAGKQLLLFRTGGMDEGPDGFELKHREFWLFPTRFHQTEGLIRSGMIDGLNFDTPGDRQSIPILDFCEVQAVDFVADTDRLRQLEPWHVLSPEVLNQRFEYRSPGLYVIVLRAYRLEAPHWLAQKQEYDGCKSWVSLDDSISAKRLTPVLPLDEFRSRSKQISAIMRRG